MAMPAKEPTTLVQEELKFDVSLTAHDWDSRRGGWHCHALRLPGSAIAAFFAAGVQADSRTYKADKGFIEWSGAAKPENALVSVVVKPLSTPTSDEGIEQEKLRLEQRKFELERKWRYVGAAGAVLGALLTAAIQLGLSASILRPGPEACIEDTVRALSNPDQRIACIVAAQQWTENYAKTGRTERGKDGTLEYTLSKTGLRCSCQTR